jgi:alginate O-acetyltransferase complex protein AlgI
MRNSAAAAPRRFNGGFLPLIVLPAGVLLAWQEWGSAWHRWVVMWAMAVVIFMACKWLTWINANRAGVPAWRQAGYWLLWPGLDAVAFLGTGRMRTIARPVLSEWIWAAFNLALGAGLFWGVARCWPESWWLGRGWTGMAGFILAAHCGAFQLLSCAWRAAGVDARPMMDAPLLSRSVSEFWGRRWNTAFRDLAHRFLFQPLAHRLGPRHALAAGFIFSGLVHELVVTIPAGGGYGGPTFFFSCQGFAILFEHSRAGRAWGLGRGGRGWLFTMAALGLPLGLAFPPVFVQRIILPFMQTAGAF